MLDDNRRKPLISLEKQIAQPVKPLILHNNEIGTFCIDCTGTPLPLAISMYLCGGA